MILVDPQYTIPVSLTEQWCALNCAHCGRHYLSSMKTLHQMEEYIQKGYRSFLISGGLNYDGEIPYNNEILKKLELLKKKYDLQYNFHIGFPLNPVHKLKDIADVVSFDFFADPKIMKKIYGVDRNPIQQIEIAMSSEIFSVPHVTLGIDCGKITHEYRSIEMLSEYFDSIVLNILIPTIGTAYESCTPPSIEEVKSIFKYTKTLFKVVILGCMQPKGSYRSILQNELLDTVDVIVKPVGKAISDFHGCCSFLSKQILQGVTDHVR